MSFFYESAPLVGFVLNTILAYLVLRRHLHSRLHQVFSLFLIAMALWAFTIVGMRRSPTLAAALPWEHAIFVALPFVSIFFYHFALLFTRVKIKAWQIVPPYLVTIGFAGVAAATNLIVAGMRTMWYGHGFIAGALFNIYMGILYGFVIIGLVLMVRARLKPAPTLEKTRYLYVAIGTFVCVLGLFFDFIAARGVARIYPLGIPSNILFSGLCAYAILRYQLLDIQLVIRKGTAYILVSAIGTTLYIGLLIIAYFFIDRVWSLPFYLNLPFIVLVSVGLQPTLRWTQSFVDRWFYRGRYDYLRTLERLGEETKAITELAVIARSLVGALASALQCDSVSLLLPDVEDKNFVLVASHGKASRSYVRLPRQSVLVWWLVRYGSFVTLQDINTTPQLQAFTLKEREVMDALDPELFIPLTTREGLRGILSLGHKLSGQDYSSEEISMLRVLSRQIATSLDNARLYDLQKQRYLEQALLAKIGLIVSSELDIKKLSNLFAEELKEVIPVDYISINLKEDTNGFLLAHHEWSKLGPLPGGAAPVAANGVPAIDDAEVYYEADQPANGKALLAPGFYDAGIQSVLRLPLQTEGVVLGNIIFAARGRDAYGDDNRRLLRQVATQLAIAIDKSRLYTLEKKARQELEKQDQERTEFINSLIHEVKTPLTAMLASSELLREELAQASTLGDLAENMDIAAHNLDQRVSELVDFVRVQRTEIKLNLGAIDLPAVVQMAASHVAGLSHNKQQELVVDVPSGMEKVKADPERLLQILLNLLTNASKFSGRGTKITLHAFSQQKYAIVEVRDSAPAITPEEAQRIFSPYYRSRRRESGGLGLGLSICRKLVQLHGGILWLEPGETGNSFKFSLPFVGGKGGEVEGTAR